MEKGRLLGVSPCTRMADFGNKFPCGKRRHKKPAGAYIYVAAFGIPSCESIPSLLWQQGYSDCAWPSLKDLLGAHHCLVRLYVEDLAFGCPEVFSFAKSTPRLCARGHGWNLCGDMVCPSPSWKQTSNGEWMGGSNPLKRKRRKLNMGWIESIKGRQGLESRRGEQGCCGQDILKLTPSKRCCKLEMTWQHITMGVGEIA